MEDNDILQDKSLVSTPIQQTGIITKPIRVKQNIGDNGGLQTKKEYPAFKYSNNKKDSLHESIILGGRPAFIKYEKEEIYIVEDAIEENSRIIKPPAREDYPYEPYEFADIHEINAYIDKAKNANLDSLYSKAKAIDQKYIDQDDAIINLIAADTIWSYHQDLFATTHYISISGDPETGKSSIGCTFEYTGYRPIRGTSITTANYYRALGIIEPGQATTIEDEADNVEEDSDKIKILNAGYEYIAKVPRTNMNSTEQKQNWFYAYCFKIIISAKPLSSQKAKGLIERTFNFCCRTGSNNNYSIKDIVVNPLGDLYKELIDFRKLMLCFRLIHYKDTIQAIDTGLKNRDKELGGPLLQLFHGTKALSEIANALQVFLSQRKERKENTLEAAVIYPVIVSLIAEKKTCELTLELIWEAVRNRIPGCQRNQDQYQTYEYGSLYRNTISTKIVDKFGAERKRKKDGIVLIFDKDKLKQFEEKTYYSNSSKPNVVQDVKNEVSQDESVGCVGNEASGRSVSITEATQFYHAVDNNDKIQTTSSVSGLPNSKNSGTNSLQDSPNSIPCQFCHYTATDSIDMELHRLQKHKEEIGKLTNLKKTCDTVPEAVIVSDEGLTGGFIN